MPNGLLASCVLFALVAANGIEHSNLSALGKGEVLLQWHSSHARHHSAHYHVRGDDAGETEGEETQDRVQPRRGDISPIHLRTRPPRETRVRAIIPVPEGEGSAGGSTPRERSMVRISLDDTKSTIGPGVAFQPAQQRLQDIFPAETAHRFVSNGIGAGQHSVRRGDYINDKLKHYLDRVIAKHGSVAQGKPKPKIHKWMVRKSKAASENSKAPLLSPTVKGSRATNEVSMSALIFLCIVLACFIIGIIYTVMYRRVLHSVFHPNPGGSRKVSSAAAASKSPFVA